MAVKMVVQATLRTQSVEFESQRKFMLGDAGFDGNKGLAVAFVPGTTSCVRQFCSPALFGGRAGAGRGFLHRTNALDTLGDDEPESSCRMSR